MKTSDNALLAILFTVVMGSCTAEHISSNWKDVRMAEVRAEIDRELVDGLGGDE